jgi:hypothetical protein
MKSAVAELSFLLGRGYSHLASVKLVGDRYQFPKLIRRAVLRAAVAPNAIALRERSRVDVENLAGREVWIDGFNLIITVERGIRGHPVFRCADSVIRDIAGVHGTFRISPTTEHALERIQAALDGIGVTGLRWFFDRPISKSGDMAKLARNHGEAEVVEDPDRELIQTTEAVIISSDGAVLQHCDRWFNLVDHMVEDHITTAPCALESGNCNDFWVVDLKPD